MSSVRSGAPGATRVCPHCKATVLASAAVCPGCRHHLRFNAGVAQPETDDSYRALSIDGTITHRRSAEPCEYCVVLDIRNERGEQLVRQVVGVGALQTGEMRLLNVSVDLTPVRAVIARSPAAAQPGAPAGPVGPAGPLPPLKPPPAVKTPPAAKPPAAPPPDRLRLFPKS